MREIFIIKLFPMKSGLKQSYNGGSSHLIQLLFFFSFLLPVHKCPVNCGSLRTAQFVPLLCLIIFSSLHNMRYTLQRSLLPSSLCVCPPVSGHEDCAHRGSGVWCVSPDDLAAEKRWAGGWGGEGARGITRWLTHFFFIKFAKLSCLHFSPPSVPSDF